LSPDEIDIVIDQDYCLGSYLVSWIQANTNYRQWLVKEMKILNNPGQATGEKGVNSPELYWTASKTDLVEVINGMYLAGAFNNGKLDLKQVVEWFELHMDIDLGHFYNTFQQIARRKKERTKFLDLMKERLGRQMDEMD
jgi:hypothetical protein